MYEDPFDMHTTIVRCIIYRSRFDLMSAINLTVIQLVLVLRNVVTMGFVVTLQGLVFVISVSMAPTVLSNHIKAITRFHFPQAQLLHYHLLLWVRFGTRMHQTTSFMSVQKAH